MSSGSGTYIHGSDPEEQRRLSLLNTILNDTSLAALDVRPGERILDVGSGLGQLSRAFARRSGVQVLGIERDPEQIAEAERQAAAAGEDDLVEFRLGDATDLPLRDDEWGSFDVAHSRFLLEHLPEPQLVVDAMVRALRRGGRIALEDDDHDLLRLWPEVPGLSRLWNAYLQTYERLGNDPAIGRKLVTMLHAAGAEPVRNELLFFGSCAGHPSFRALVDNFIGLIQGAPDAIVESGDLSRAELERTLATFDAWGDRGDAAMWYATCWACGEKR